MTGADPIPTRGMEVVDEELGMIGLGRMGANMAGRLLAAGHESSPSIAPREGAGAGRRRAPPARARSRNRAEARAAARDLAHGAGGGRRRQHRRAAAASWTRRHDHRRRQLVLPRRHPPRESLAEAGIHYVDVGTSGGVWGLERGYCLMIGGERRRRERLDPIFAALAPGADAAQRTPGRAAAPTTAEHGYLHCGPSGAGHFVKMVHNGIEYGLMAAYAEGLNILQARQRRQGRSTPPTPRRRRCAIPSTTSTTSTCREITEVWRRGSVIASWLLDLTAAALCDNPDLATSPAASPTPARAAGRSRRRSTRACRRPSSPRRSPSASPRAATRTSPTACSRRCASNSVATSRRGGMSDAGRDCVERAPERVKRPSGPVASQSA